MKAQICCKVTEKDEHSFYLNVNGKRYFLFKQNYRKSNKEVFGRGILVRDLGSYSGHYSTTVRKTVEKLPAYIRYIENEYGLTVLTKTELKQNQQKTKKPYKRTPFIWQKYSWEVA